MNGYVLPIQNAFVKITNLTKQNTTKFGTAKTLFLLVKSFQNRYTKLGIFRGKNGLGETAGKGTGGHGTADRRSGADAGGNRSEAGTSPDHGEPKVQKSCKTDADPVSDAGV